MATRAPKSDVTPDPDSVEDVTTEPEVTPAPEPDPAQERSPFAAHAAAWAADVTNLADRTTTALADLDETHAALAGHDTDNTDGAAHYHVPRVRAALADLARELVKVRTVVNDLTQAAG